MTQQKSYRDQKERTADLKQNASQHSIGIF